MHTQQALVAVKGDFEGPWLRVRGYEVGINVKGLGNGERVVLDMEVDGQLQLPIEFLSNGSYPFPRHKILTKYKFRKYGSDPDAATSVEIVIE